MTAPSRAARAEGYFPPVRMRAEGHVLSDDARYTILQGDCLQTLRTLPAGSVQTCVTSPPYYGLRDYGTAEWEGGDPECDHVEKFNRNDGDRQDANGFAGSANREGHAHMGAKQYRDTCRKCGARRIDNQIGLEETPSCGRHGQLRIKRDLTPDQLRYVIQRLLDAGLLGGQPYGTNGRG